MRRKVNIVTTTLFIISAVAAVYFGWIDDDAVKNKDDRTWPICLVLLGITFIIGIVRFALLYKAYKDEKEEYIPVRSVTFDETVEEDTPEVGEEVEEAEFDTDTEVETENYSSTVK